MKILWLVSWYPDRFQPFNGDFIQRHAKAAASYNDIEVIHVAVGSGKEVSLESKETHKYGRLTEQVICLKKYSSLFGRVITHFKWRKYFRRAIRYYISKNGKPDIVHVHIPMKAGLLALWVKRKYGVPFVVTEHWGIYNEIVAQNYKAKNIFFKTGTKKILKDAIAFTSVSRYLGVEMNKWVIKKDFLVIPNTVDTDFFSFKQAGQKDKFRFIHVSNMAPLKNVEGILKAFRLVVEENENAELILVGDTDPLIRRLAIELKLMGEKIFFRGEMLYPQVAEEMKQSDCLVLFSNIENSPCVISEALCCGLPVIATKTGGIPELVDESDSIIVEPGNEKALSAAMKEMINMYTRFDRKKIAEMASKRFNYSVIGKAFDGLYKTIISADKYSTTD